MSRQQTRRELAAFRARVISRFALHRLSCDCAGISHEPECPLGDVEIEAEALRVALRDWGHWAQARALLAGMAAAEGAGTADEGSEQG